jgi:hypothetical protein
MIQEVVMRQISIALQTKPVKRLIFFAEPKLPVALRRSLLCVFVFKLLIAKTETLLHMKKKNLNQLQLKKNTIANFENDLRGGGFIYPYPSIKYCNTVIAHICASDPVICFTADRVCQTI